MAHPEVDVFVLILFACYSNDLEEMQADLDVLAEEAVAPSPQEYIDYATVCFTRYDSDDCGASSDLVDFIEECHEDDYAPCVVDGLDDLGADGWHLIEDDGETFIRAGAPYVMWRYL